MRCSARALLAVAAIGLPIPARAQPAVLPAPNFNIAPATSDGAKGVLAAARPSIVQIKGLYGSNTAQAFHGTGFAVASGGVFLTNYHVVAQKVQHPTKYRLEYRTAEGATGAVEVLAVDVRHDLALVRAAHFAPPPLRFAAAIPMKGARAYSIGFPLDVGLTITEGISNGKVDASYEPRIHYSGAINGGMSGGPALNAEGEVIGINVSGYRFEQLISFLVPAEHAAALVKPVLPDNANPDALKQDVARQLRAHSRALLEALAGAMPTQATAGFQLPAKLAPFVDCNAGGDPASQDPVQAIRIGCAAKAGVFVQQGLMAGDIRFSHTVLTTEKLDAWRFARRLSNQSSGGGSLAGLIGFIGGGPMRLVGPYACEDRVVGLKGFDARVVVCTRAYRKFDGLYDFVVRVTSMSGSKRGFASRLNMTGHEFDSAMMFVQRYVQGMELQP